ncbi:uncharacterized protein BP01DRAFT_402635, partial [Aspergillus saccharolyticus JOP 1030-1]
MESAEVPHKEEKLVDELSALLEQTAAYYTEEVFDEDDKVRWLTKSAKALQWIFAKASQQHKPKPEAEKPEEEAPRQVATPKIEPVPWKEWSKTQGPCTEPHSAIYLLADEPPARQRSRSGRPGAPALPNRIRIRSLPVMRILLGLCDGSLEYHVGYGLVIMRPFKILVHLEQEIRNRLAELEQAHYSQGPQAKIPASSSTDEHEAPPSVYSLDDIFKAETDWTSLTLKEKEEAAKDFRCLVSFMDEYVLPVRAALQTTTEVLFSELWHLFTPGSLIYVPDKMIPQKVWRIIQGTGGRRNMEQPSMSDRQFELGGGIWNDRCNPFVLDCYYIDWNGTQFVRVHKVFTIQEFQEVQPVTSLPVFPLHTAEQLNLVDRTELLARANHFLQYTKPGYRYYSGRSLNLAPDGRKLRQANPDPTSMGTVATPSEYIESQVMVDFERALQSIPEWSPESPDATLSKTPAAELAGDETDRYIEDDRVWDLRIAESPVEPRKEAWQDLEIDPGHRNIIQSLMETHFSKSRPKRRQFDLVRDKGKGLIILLHGVPGVGKTSTAETVAEYYNKPLLPITCGDLGLTPRDVERNLENCFQMAQAWECVLLLDEADVFLAERSADNVDRNALVSVFLRVLEYYEGVLFLTTNKAQHPEYKPIWNGRQIRNAFQTAIALAEFKAQDKHHIPLTRDHFIQVTSVSNQFNSYLWAVKHRRNDEYENLRKGLRADGFAAAPTAAPAASAYTTAAAPAAAPAAPAGAPTAPGFLAYPPPNTAAPAAVTGLPTLNVAQYWAPGTYAAPPTTVPPQSPYQHPAGSQPPPGTYPAGPSGYAGAGQPQQNYAAQPPQPPAQTGYAGQPVQPQQQQQMAPPSHNPNAHTPYSSPGTYPPGSAPPR